MPMIFIVGVGRSGTSLLQSMFAAHEEVIALPETSFLRRFAFSKRVPVSAIENDKTVSRLSGLSDLDEPPLGRSWAIHLSNHYHDVVGSEKNKFVLDKDPRLVEFLPELAKHFQEMKVLHIYRDPRDVLASKKKAAWSAGRTLFSYLVASRVPLSDATKFAKKYQVVSIKYEKLIASPETVLKSACKQIGLSYDDKMLKYSEAAKRLVQPSELSWKKETFKPLMRGNSGKWKVQLNPVESLSAYLSVRAFCRENGYDVDLSNYSIKEKAISLMIVRFVILASSVYKLRRTFQRKMMPG
jgi:hypothetical protein